MNDQCPYCSHDMLSDASMGPQLGDPLPTEPTDTQPVPVKPGFLTTEFWATVGAVAANCVGALTALNVIPAADTSQVTSTVAAIISGLQLVVVNGALAIYYVKSRTAVKQAVIQDRTHRMMIRQNVSLQRQRMALQFAPRDAGQQPPRRG